MHSLNLLSGSSSFPVKLLLPRQGLSTDLGNAKNTLSSWDSCMSKAYCKWPVIVAIIVAALIILSILFCIVRCCCCGLECCCGCFQCCNMCCPSPRNHKTHQQASQQPPYYQQGWQHPQAPQSWAPSPHHAPPQQPQPYDLGMMSGALQSESPKPAPSASLAPRSNPSVARFSTEKPPSKVATKPLPYKNPSNEDQLPQMPTWGAATERRIEDPTPQPVQESEAATGSATGQQGILLKDQTPQRQPTQPDSQRVELQEQGVHRRPTLPALDSNTSGAKAPPFNANESWRTQTPASTYSNAADTAAVGAAYGSRRTRAPSSRQQTPQNAYGYGPPPRRPSERQLSPHTQPDYPPHGPNYRTVSPISPITPAQHSAGAFSANPPPSYHTYNGTSAPPLPGYVSRQNSHSQAPYGPSAHVRSPPPQLGPPPIPRNQNAQAFGAPPPAQQWGGAYGNPVPSQPVYAANMAPQYVPSAPQGRAMPTPAPASVAPQPEYQAYNPFGGRGQVHEMSGEQTNDTAGRVELSGAEPAKRAGEVRYELGGGDGMGEGGEWQRKPVGGWS